MLLAFSLVFAGLAVGTAASPQGDDARSEHQRIVDFWTVDKVRQAIPRDFVLDAASGRFVPAARGGSQGPPDGGGNGGGKGGGGGGGDVSVTGAHWDNGGTVQTSTGKVLFSFPKVSVDEDAYFVCSASVVDYVADGVMQASTVVTAAHCVYENDPSNVWVDSDGTPFSVEVGFANNWIYIPDYEKMDASLSLLSDNFCESTPLGCWAATSLVLHEGFAEAGGFNGTAIQYDFAFAVLTGNSNLNAHGDQDIKFDAVSKGMSTYAFGYPHDKIFKGDLRYCAGDVNFDNRFFKLSYKLKCDMTGGASGGPWFAPFTDTSGVGTVISVNSYRYSGGDAMYGPKFNADTQAIYNAAAVIGANEDCVVLATGGCDSP
jgi:hypothetical protein